MTKIKTKPGWFFNIVKSFFRLIKREPKIFNKNKGPLEQSILLSNHSAASGPLTLSLYLPIFFAPWGTYQMTENYIQRWKYLYHVFYQQKIGYNKFISFVLASGFALISKMLYNGIQLIPTYPDLRFKRTLDISLEHLAKGNSILIFPEDSDTGYHEKLLKYNNGFACLSEKHFKETGINLPIYPIYYHQSKSAMIIGEKVDITKLRAKGMNRTQIAAYFKDLTNELAEELFELVDK